MKNDIRSLQFRSFHSIVILFIVIPSFILFFPIVGNVGNFYSGTYPAVPYYRQVDDINPIWAPDGWTLAFERLNKSGVSGQEIYCFMPFSKEKLVTPISIINLAERQPFYAGYLCWSDIDKSGFLKYIYAKLPDLYIGKLPILYDPKGSLTLKETLFISGQKEAETFENKYSDWSLDGNKIAFVSGATGNGDIYIKDYKDYKDYKEPIKASIKSAKRLTYSEALELSPKWSPDGSQPAYASYKSGDSDILLIKNFNVSKPTSEVQLTRSPFNETNPVWSPDGSKIAFYVLKSKTSESMEELCDLWVIDSDGRNSRKVADNIYRQQKRGPTWLPTYPENSSQKLTYVGSNLDKVYIHSVDHLGDAESSKAQIRGLSGYIYGHITDIAAPPNPERSYLKNGARRVPLNFAYSALNRDGEKRIYWEKIDLKTLSVIPESEYKLNDR